jgi:tape measure domain-containing protein
MAELEVIIDGQPARRGAQVVVRSLDDIRKASDNAGRQFDKATKKSKTLSLAMQQLKAVALPLAAAFGVKEIIQTTNEYQNLQNQLRVVTDSEQGLAAANERLFEITQKTRTPLEATVGLFSKASIAAKELGASQEQLYQLVETTGKALAVGGVSAQEASGSLRQLSQAFSSGIVRAEEFNSILEGAFPLAQAAAKGLDAAAGSVGKLRNLVTKGKVSSKEFFDAILKGGTDLDKKFAQTQLTLGQAFTQIGNSFTKFIGKIGESSGASAGLARVLSGVSKFIDQIGKALFDTLTPTDKLTAGTKLLASAFILMGQAVSLTVAPIKLIWNQFEALGTAIGGVAAAFVQFANGEFSNAADTMKAVFADATDSTISNYRNAYDEAVASTSDTIEKLVTLWDEGSRQIAEAQKTPADTGGGKTAGPSAAELAAKAKEAAKLAKALDQQAEALKTTVDPLYVYEKELDKINTLLLSDRINEEQAAAAINKAGAAYAAANPELQKHLALLQEGKDLTESLRTPQESYNASIIHYTDLLNKGAIDAEAFGRAVTKANTDLADANKKLDPAAKAMEQFGIQAARNIQSSFADFLFNPFEGGVKGMVKGFADALRRMAAEALSNMILQKLFSAAGGAAGGGGFGSILTGIAGSFAGRANGGPLQAGQAAVVGETGKPELFIPKQDGTVVPAGKIGGGAPPQVNVPVEITNVVDPASMVGAMESAQGTKAILNVIQTNPDAVKRALS